MREVQMALGAQEMKRTNTEEEEEGVIRWRRRRGEKSSAHYCYPNKLTCVLRNARSEWETES